VAKIKECYVVGVCGASASGKSTFGKDIVKYFNSQQPGIATILHMDDYFRAKIDYCKDKDGKYVYDVPDNINLSSLAMDLAWIHMGNSFGKPIRDFETGVVTANISFNPTPIIVLEGVFLLYFKICRNLIDYSIFLDTDYEVRMQRRLERDHSINIEFYENTVEPAYQKYILPYRKFSDKQINSNEPVKIDVIKSLYPLLIADMEYQKPIIH
jgi:uridine kinase